MTVPLDRVRALNYDHHRRMTEQHLKNIKSGRNVESAAMDDKSYRTLLANVPKDQDFILELGSASGGQWPLLQEWLAVGGQIVGIDLYEPLVLQAQASGLPITLGFVEEMPYDDGAFTLVCSRHVMEHLGDLEKGMREILRVTAPGGYIAHVTPNMDYDNELSHLNHLNEAGWVQKWQSVGLDIRYSKRHPFHGGEVHIVGKKV